MGVVVGVRSDFRLGKALIFKGNVRASKGETPIYECSFRLDLNLSNPRVGGSNPPGRVVSV